MPINTSQQNTGVTGAAKFVTSTLGNTVGGVTRTVGCVTGAATRGVGDTITSVTGSAGWKMGRRGLLAGWRMLGGGDRGDGIRYWMGGWSTYLYGSL